MSGSTYGIGSLTGGSGGDARSSPQPTTSANRTSARTRRSLLDLGAPNDQRPRRSGSARRLPAPAAPAMPLMRSESSIRLPADQLGPAARMVTNTPPGSARSSDARANQLT